MPGHGEKMSRKQEGAIAALLTAPSVAAAAEVAGIGVQTLIRWMRDADFARAHLAARREAVSQASARLARACGDAVEALQATAADAATAPGTRVNAARAILEYAYRAVEVDDLAPRLAELEALLLGSEGHAHKTS